MHVPVWQTMLVPHEVPFALLPVSVHTEAPLVQTVAAVLHGFAVVQAVPAVQGTHVPLLHTMVPLVKVCIDQRPEGAKVLRYALRPVG